MSEITRSVWRYEIRYKAKFNEDTIKPMFMDVDKEVEVSEKLNWLYSNREAIGLHDVKVRRIAYQITERNGVSTDRWTPNEDKVEWEVAVQDGFPACPHCNHYLQSASCCRWLCPNCPYRGKQKESLHKGWLTA